MRLRQFLWQFSPMVGGGLLMCSTNLVDVGVASFLPPGGIAALSYANRIPQAMVSLSAGALGTAVLPFFSQLVAGKDWKGLRKVAGTYLLGTMTLAILLTTGLVLGSRFMVALLFQHGAFGAIQTTLVGRVQAMYFLQIPFYICGILVVRLISALGHNEILLPAAAFSAIMNLCLDLLLLPHMGLPGIALSTALVHLFTLILLSLWALRLLRRAEAAV
jgi:putative peptidoglycan lipid II flippase